MSFYGRKLQESHDIELLLRNAENLKFIAKQLHLSKIIEKTSKIIYVCLACGSTVDDYSYRKLRNNVNDVRHLVKNVNFDKKSTDSKTKSGKSKSQTKAKATSSSKSKKSKSTTAKHHKKSTSKRKSSKVHKNKRTTSHKTSRKSK